MYLHSRITPYKNIGTISDDAAVLIDNSGYKGVFDISYYEKTKKSEDMFIPQQKQVINL